jgi:hypothetical protein
MSSLRVVALSVFLFAIGCSARQPAAYPQPRPGVAASLGRGLESAAPPSSAEIRSESGRRTTFFIVGGVAAVAGAVAVGSTIAGELENQAIKDGGFATGSDIADAASRGDTFNQVAFVSGAVALGALGAAIGLYIYGSPTESRGRSGSAKILPRRVGFAF